MKGMINNDESVSLASKIEIFIGRTRIAFRNLLKNPLITISAIISIALGIGTATAMFSIYDEFLLRHLPVPEPEKLVNFSSPGPKPGNLSTNPKFQIAIGVIWLIPRKISAEWVSCLWEQSQELKYLGL